MKVRNVMTTDIVTIPPETPVEDAARIMRDHKTGRLLIGARNNVAGVITDRDITIRVTAESKDPKRTAVQDIMTEHCPHCYDDAKVEDACFHKHAPYLIVEDHNHDVVGILSLNDVAMINRSEKLAALEITRPGRTA
jgi:CBS domain-containing protein